jgi:tetratricopeptide (TPR) repeat protein
MQPTHETLAALAGTVLADKYQLKALLGMGGMGVVYQAEQLGLGRSVAIKLLRRDLLATRFDWFRAEAMAASRINHPHAVAIYDFGVSADGVPYLVMEHLHGRTLSRLIEAAPLSLERILRIAGQVLSALTEAHACGVVHCDLTGDNVIVDQLRAGDDFAKVIDFGLARLFDGTTTEGRIIGTAEYMAPEQIRGELISPATDLYAVGVLLYEMIVGRTPFAGASVPVILQGHLTATPIPPDQVVPSCPPELSALVMDALAKSPDQRPPSAADMHEQLFDSLPSQSTQVRKRLAAPLTRPAPVHSTALGSLPIGRLSAPMRGLARRSTRVTCELGRAQGQLIGRDRELARAIEHCRGDAHNLEIVGPTGIGKARLILALGEQLGARQRCFVAAADPSGLAGSWYPILGLLEQTLELRSPIDSEQLSQAVSRAGLPDRDLPGLAELFSLPSALSNLELAVRRREAHAAALRTLAAVNRRHPRAVIAFVDADRFDHPSLQLVRQLAKVAPGQGLTVVATSRGALDLGGATIELDALEPRASRELTIQLAGTPMVPEAAVVQTLTGGVPEAIEQLAGWLGFGDGTGEMPQSLVDVMSVRINRLACEERRVLQAVAVHGTVAARWLVEASLSPDEVIAIDVARWGDMLVVEADTLTIPSPLLASVIGASTPADVRRRLHWRAYEALGDGAPPGIRGHHAARAGELRRAFDLYLAAGHDAARRFDDPGAAAWYGQAVAMARALQARGERDASEELVDASLLLAELLRLSGEKRLALGTLDEAGLNPQSERQQAVADRIRGLIALRSGDPRKAISLLQRAVGAALRAGERNMLCQTYIDLADALVSTGQADRAIDELRQAIDVITLGEGMRTTTPPDRLWRVGKALAEKYLAAGKTAEAKEMALSAHAHARRLGWPLAQGRLSALLAQICEAADEHSPALRHRANAIEEMRRLGDRRSTAELLIESAKATRRRRRPDSEPITGTAWVANPDETLRLASRLAAEIGWDEGVELSDRGDES